MSKKTFDKCQTPKKSLVISEGDNNKNREKEIIDPPSILIEPP